MRIAKSDNAGYQGEILPPGPNVRKGRSPGKGRLEMLPVIVKCLMDLQAMMMTTRIIEAATSEDELHSIMVAITQELGFERFALIHHVDGAEAKDHAINLHNYPPRWADHYFEQDFGLRDPVHRASRLSSCGFRWEKLPDMLPLDAGDREMLAMARDHGIANGFTIPANVPGEAHGSITFANPVDYSLPIEMLPLAHWIVRRQHQWHRFEVVI